MENKKATEPTAPKKEGYTFLGWYLNDTKFDFNNTKITKNITLIAKWKKIVKYKVTFNSEGGSAVAEQNVVEGEKVTRPNDPTKDGFAFTGWLLNGNAYDFNKPVTAAFELTATWKPKYVVTFDSNGGSSVNSQTIIEGNKATRPANPTRNGFKFLNWLDESGQPFDFGTTITGPKTLTASWEEIANYTVRVSTIDNFSLDRRLTVYKNGSVITVKEIKYTDGVHLCSGSNPTVNVSDIEGVTSFKVVLSNDQEVTATLES